MATDLTEIQASDSVKISGADPSTGVESFYAAVDSAGRLNANTTPLDGIKATYSASIISATLAGSATDFFLIKGSATKTIRVLTTAVSFTGGGSVVNAQLLKRSTANTGGTSTTQPNVPHDSNNVAGTASIVAYTANPTGLGNLVGGIRAAKTDSPLTSSTTAPQWIEFFFGNRPGQGIVLRGTGESLAWNFNGATLSSGAYSAYIEWTEE